MHGFNIARLHLIPVTHELGYTSVRLHASRVKPQHLHTTARSFLSTIIRASSNHQCRCWLTSLYTLSGRIGKVVLSHAEGCKVAKSNPGCGWAAPIYKMQEALRGYCPWGCGCDQLIGSTVFDAIVRGWLWSTATSVPHLATSVITVSSWKLTPHSVLVDSAVGGS